MIDLKKKLEDAKRKAKKLMSAGKVTEYIHQLTRIEALQLQLVRVSK